jgi:hypothetical protein
MMPEQEVTQPTQPIAPVQLKVSGRTLALITGGGLVAGTLIVVGAIMPAEFNVDPLGIGKLSGIARLWAPDENTWKPGAGMEPAHSSATPMTRTVMEIPLGASDWPEAALEYKFAMKPGETLLYRWQALNEDGTPATIPVEFDFHGHTRAVDDQEMTVATYRKDQALSDSGSLMAPFDGIHGWYFRNHSPDPIRIRLEATGFYALIPPGQPGNEFKLRPKESAPWEPAPVSPPQ